MVLKHTDGLTKMDVYKLTHPVTSKRVKDAGKLQISKYAIVLEEETNKKVIYVESEGEVYASISPTFLRSFQEILEIGEELPEVITVVVDVATSNRGREFITAIPDFE